MPRTRSGRLFRQENLHCEQISPWAAASEVLMVMHEYVDFSSLLKGRLVCQAWRVSFSTPVKHLQLEQPASARTGLALGRKAATAFTNATTISLKLLKVQDPPIDLTADDGDDKQPQLFGPDNLGRPAAGAALLRQLSKGCRLQHLQLCEDISQTCICLPALLKAVPQLLVLDLSCCAHNPADLLVLTQHAPGLQELLLHCQAFVTLSGRRIRHGNPEWGRHGGNTRYQPEHLAALAHLPQLQLLECPLPASYERKGQAADWFTAVGSLTSLTGLHVIRHGRSNIRPPASAVTALSRLTRLRELRCEAGGPDMGKGGYIAGKAQAPGAKQQAEAWGVVLPCMPHLTRLELVEAAAGDPLLCAIGSSLPQLQRLVFETECWESRESKAGADAVAHVGHIELSCVKGLTCCQNLHLLQLPGVKRVQIKYAFSVVGRPGEMQGGSLWKQETCMCQECWMRRR